MQPLVITQDLGISQHSLIVLQTDLHERLPGCTDSKFCGPFPGAPTQIEPVNQVFPVTFVISSTIDRP